MERIAVPAGARAGIRRPKRLLALRSDDRLVEHVRAGDDAAFEVLYERHVAGVLGFCRHMLGSQDEAEDAVQQAFVSAHRDMLRGSREINFKPWLYTIARNRCLSMLRARREQAAELPEISTAGLATSVEERSDLRDLVRDVQRLPHDQREALVLSELGDLSHAQIADVLGVEPMTVKALVFRARSALIERRDARAVDCEEVRAELAVATGGGLRRSRLRYHLEGCPGCQAYLQEVRRQRKLLGVALPVVPTLALHDSVMAAAGIGGAAAVAGGALATGGAATGAALGGGAVATTAPLIGGTIAKVAIVGVIAAGGVGVATEVARDDGRKGGRSGVTSELAPGSGPALQRSVPPGVGAIGHQVSGERSKGARGAERRGLGQQRAAERSDGKSAVGREKGAAQGQSRSDIAPGRALPKRMPDDGSKPAEIPRGGRKPAEIPRATPPKPPRAAPVTPERPVVPPKSKGGGVQPPSSPRAEPPATTPVLPPRAKGQPPVD